MTSTNKVIMNENKMSDKSKTPDVVEEKEKIKGKKQSKEKKKSEEQSRKVIHTDMQKCNKYDEVCEAKSCSESSMLKKDFKCDECNFSCEGLITLRKHVNTKHPRTVTQSETGPVNKARNESFKKYDNKVEDNSKPEYSETLQCETPVVCEFIGCCWCKYQVER